MSKIASAALLVALLAGCQTRYQTSGFTGGVEAQQLTATTYRIAARGNAFTSATTIQDYVLLRAAETTIAAGATHFIVGSTADRARQFSDTRPGSAQTTFVGNTAVTNFTPGGSVEYVKPGQDTIIQVLTIGPGQAPPAGALSAQEVVQFVGPRVQRG